MAHSPYGSITHDRAHLSTPAPHGLTPNKTSEDVLAPIHDSPLTASMNLLPLDIVVQKIVQSLIDSKTPHTAFENLEILPPGRLHTPLVIKRPDGNHLVLSLPPTANIRLMRYERSSIRSEAAVLQWLSDLAEGDNQSVMETLAHQCQGGNIGGKGDDKRLISQQLNWNLHAFLPKLINHGSVNVRGYALYNLSTPSLGTSISALSQPLSSEEQRVVDFQSGQLLRRVSLYRSPNRRFGMPADVLAQTITRFRINAPRTRGGFAPNANLWSSCWSEAFNILLESALRDAEDFTVNLSYHCIRDQFKRFQHILDRVTRPCLVVMDIGGDANTLVLRFERDTEGENVVSSNKDDEQNDKKASGSGGTHGRIDVTGLREWSHGVFGDPLIASAFSQNPGPDFLRGFHSPLQDPEPGVLDYPSSPVEDREHAHVRLLLYECYHSVAAIAKEFCRQQDASYEREMAGRKKLVNVLARLRDLDDEGNPKRKRQSMEMAPAKRPKSETCDDQLAGVETL